ncbi:hypothetical protein JCM5350_003935 [Sporobolomyces pararoseus]
MFLELSGTAKIDRLSSLPPELLSNIFDLAHDPEQPLIEPLSRTLLPYFRQTLYRQLDISSSALSKLLSTVEKTPFLSLLVQDLTVRDGGRLPNAPFALVAKRFPSLKYLNYGTAQFSDLDSVPVAPLQSLSYTPEVFDTNEIDALARLPLITLELELHSSKSGIPDNFQPSTTLQTLEELTLIKGYLIRDDDKWDTNVSYFVKSCPALRSLEFVDDASPGFGKILQDLVGGVPLLTKLEFDTPTLDEVSFCPDAHYGFESAENFFSLVRAPTKPPALKLLILECFEAKIGFQCDTQDEMKSHVLESWSFRGAWNEASFSRNIEEEECRQLLELAKANEVQVEGDIYAAIDYPSSWNLEVANRHVLYAFQHQTLELLKDFKESHQAQHYSDFDLDKLDHTNLKLVKIDAPEEKWYRFTLE